MTTAGIIAEFNPFHEGHAFHIRETKRMSGGDCAIVCVMSGNFVQRGDVAVFSKHARAKAAVLGGADLIIEMQTPYALLSAEGFAEAGVRLLDSLGICDYISFGSESGDLEELSLITAALATQEAGKLIKEWLATGLSYALALQNAADAIIGARADALKSPNNLLGIEYLKAIMKTGSKMRPLTVKRSGGSHDGDDGFSASAVRKELILRARGAAGDVDVNDAACGSGDSGDGVVERQLLGLPIPYRCAEVYAAEINAGRGPVSMETCEIAILSRLRALTDLSGLQGASEGLDRRLLRFIASEAAVSSILCKVKSKRYAMSRIRRLIISACLGVTAEDTSEPPPYIRALAMNDAGIRLLAEIKKKAQLPIIIKPASAKKLHGRAGDIFRKEVSATDFYVLAYPGQSARAAGQEWRISPEVCSGLLL